MFHAFFIRLFCGDNEYFIIFAAMNDAQRISVIINTYNAERHLEAVIEAVKDFDEIVVCDMESTDRTLDIARSYGCKVVTFPKGDLRIVEPARQFAIDKAGSPWVLVVDADEIVTPALRKYLYAAIRKADCPDAIAIPRKNYFMPPLRWMETYGRFRHHARIWLLSTLPTTALPTSSARTTLIPITKCRAESRRSMAAWHLSIVLFSAFSSLISSNGAAWTVCRD